MSPRWGDVPVCSRAEPSPAADELAEEFRRAGESTDGSPLRHDGMGLDLG